MGLSVIATAFESFCRVGSRSLSFIRHIHCLKNSVRTTVRRALPQCIRVAKPHLGSKIKVTMEERGTMGEAANVSQRQRMQDVEKIGPNLAPQTSVAAQTDSTDAEATAGRGPMRYMKSFEKTLVRYNMEARGIQRVMPEDRHSLTQLGFGQIGILWFSVNL